MISTRRTSEFRLFNTKIISANKIRNMADFLMAFSIWLYLVIITSYLSTNIAYCDLICISFCRHASFA